MKITSGIISLKRKNREFIGGYGLLNQELSELNAYSSMLHPKEKEYLDTLKYDRRKLSYFLGRIACKQAISKITMQSPSSIFIDFGIFQFPVVKYVYDSNVQVSISHCETIGLALAFPEEHPLGIDIEKIDVSRIAAIESQMTDREKQMVSQIAQPISVTYMMLWTIKEGLAKIFKTGLMTDFKFYEIQSIIPNENSFVSIFTHHGQYKAYSHLIGNYVCSVVFPKNTTIDLTGLSGALHQVL